MAPTRNTAATISTGQELTASPAAPGPAAEAVEHATRGRDRQRRRLLVMERTQALEVAAAGAAKLDVLTDHVVDRRLLAHQGDRAGHVPRHRDRASDPLK